MSTGLQDITGVTSGCYTHSLEEMQEAPKLVNRVRPER